MNVGKRIAIARGKMPQKRLGELIGVAQSTVASWEKGTNNPGFADVERIAAVVGRPPEWIVFGIERPKSALDEDFALVPVYDARVSAGPGAINDAHPEPLHFNAFRLDWLHRVATAAVKHLAVVRVQGDSMWPTLHDGDQVLLDMSVNRYTRDGLYVIRYKTDEEYQVKRLTREAKTGALTVKSDNTDYPTQDGVHDDSIQIRGRVIWLGRNIG